MSGDPSLTGLLAALAREPDGSTAQRVAELAQGIALDQRTVTRQNLDLLATYERLERLGRPLNAVASVAAVPERAADGPLRGRPVAVKDIIEVAGLPTGCGSPASDPVPATADAVVVRRLRAAGAEVFATTQCLEYAAGFAHPAIGDTRNPRDPSRTSGGSSGGSAALVAAGVCDLALGTDTGGSVRIPAAYCGVVGLKPSYGALPVTGVFPLSPTCDHVGTLTATVAGTADLVAVLAETGALADPGGPPRAGAPAFTVGVLAAQLADPSVTPAVRTAVSGALEALRAAGWEIRELTPPWLAEPAVWEEALAAIVAREASLVHRDRDTSRYADGTRALLAFGASVDDDQYARALARRAELTAAIDASLAGVDVLAGPTVGFQAPEQDPPFGVGEDSGEGRFTGPYNLSGHPAISLPVPAAGLPVGLQLAGRRGGDRSLLRVAAAAERLLARPGHVSRASSSAIRSRPLPAPPARRSSAPAGPGKLPAQRRHQQQHVQHLMRRQLLVTGHSRTLRAANTHRTHLPGPIGTLMVAAFADGEETSKVTQAGPVTMMPRAGRRDRCNPGIQPARAARQRAAVEQVRSEPGDIPVEPGIRPFVGGLRARQVQNRGECLLGQTGCRGEPPRASLREEVIHGDGCVPVLAADREGDLAVVGLMRLRHDVVGGAERH